MNGQTPVAQFREYVEQQVCTTVKGPIVPGAPISGLLPQPGDGVGLFYLPRPHTGLSGQGSYVTLRLRFYQDRGLMGH